MAQVVECQPSRCKAKFKSQYYKTNKKPSQIKTKKKEERKRKKIYNSHRKKIEEPMN
jgi:hypothetical protein